MRKLDTYQISIDGKEIEHFSFANISQQLDWHHTFNIRVPISIIGDKFNKWLGKILEINFQEQVDKDKKPVENKFKGFVTRVATTKESLENAEVVLHGQSPTFLLDSRIHCRTFTKKTLQQIVQQVLKDYHDNLFQPKVKPKTNSTIPYCVQYKETDFQFVRRLANFYGEWFFYDGTILYFGGLPTESKSITNLVLKKNLHSVDLSLKLEPTKFRLIAYDYRQAKEFSSDSSMTVSSSNNYSRSAIKVSQDLLGQETFLPLSTEVKEKSELDEIVKDRKAAMVNDLVILSGVSDAPELEVGKIVIIEGAGEQDGRYFVTSASHDIDSNGRYENQFEAIPAGIESPPEMHAVSKPFCETQKAIVEENNDPDGLGRVRVRLLWQKSPEKTPWIRVITLHSGDDKGLFFIPEIGDEVLVGFEFNHPERPFVIGSVYHGKAKPTEWKDDKNNKKAFKTKSGNQIYFSDEDGKEEIRIFNKDKKNEICLTCDGDGKIIIKSDGKLELKAKTITMEADKDISIKAGSQLKIDGGSMAEVKAGQIKLN